MSELTPETNPTHYVDNEELQRAMLERRVAVDAALAAGVEKPQVTEYIGSCIYEIARHLAYKHNFIGYSFREEMISDGIENCLRYIDNYNPYDYFKPFAYFTQISFYAFVRRIKKEKKAHAIKVKLIREIPFDAFDLQAHDETGEFTNAFIEFLQQHDTMDTSAYDKKKPKKSKKSNEPTLAAFVDEPLEEADFEVPIPLELLDDESDDD